VPDGIEQQDEIEHVFGSGEPFSLGVEEELFLVDPVSGRQTNASAAVQARLGPVLGRVERELHACQVELITNVSRDTGEAIGELAAMRQAVIAAPGHLFVRADLGQIEPRVLAAVSGDAALAAATAADDMYLPVAAQLSVDRPTAKVAMIAAMYGQTTGHGGNAGRRMRSAYPVAMGYLDAADRSAQAGQDLRTYGGRLIRMSGGAGAAEAESPGARTGRGRYGRNAVIQGAAAELFKMWAVTVRARAAPLGARIVLCLHDELLVHVPSGRAEQAAELVGDCLTETARRWAPGGPTVRFHIGLEAVDDLLADLECGFAAMAVAAVG